ncbi:MAG: type I-E CRISPR-associated protein Cse1/CasA, partial [candidate division Zixibacteria bacterium]|nr:type I-E CRISPR-associated protein Cse1/CasA [candidate division Zixibacteria bacterium]
MMNLIYDRWIPIRRNSGKEERVAPWQITEPDDPIVALAARRPDFNGALIQFLIGLLQTAVPPKNETVWENWLDSPPAPEILKECFAQYAHAFNLDGDGPRFMQDIEQIEGSEKNINALLIDSPGQQALEQNKDHFVKQGTVQAICPSCAATALFTLQTNAPSGGVGHRTSLRGGGPLTTLVILDPKGSNLAVTLWRNVWLNVLSDKALI